MFLQTLGRKYLAPTLSDPSARQEREKVQQTKKKNNIVRPNPPVNKNVIHLNDSEPNKSPREVRQPANDELKIVQENYGMYVCIFSTYISDSE